MTAYTPFTAEIRQQLRNAQRDRDVEAIDELVSRLGEYRTQLRFGQLSDFPELKVCDAICALFDDGDVVGRREAILEENRWDCEGNPLRGDMLNDGWAK